MAKKKFDPDLFGDESAVTNLQTADEQIFGRGIETSNGKRIVGKPTEITKLTADRTQPRRAVPISIRGDWDGSSKSVPDLLRRWHETAEKELSQHINIAHIFKDRDQEFSIDGKSQPIADKFMSLVYLADGIRRDGLLNPIQVHRTGDTGKIIAGERRWLAHHLLTMFDASPDKWRFIPAVDSEPDIWAQAQENGNRSPLNAIGISRQIALLVMDIHADRDGEVFSDFETLVSPGGCDRRFYAQVANGQIYHVRGFTDRILGATGLKSRAQISQYRALLNLDDETWLSADEGDWTENYCRVKFLQKTPEPENTPIFEQTLTTVNVSEKTPEYPIIIEAEIEIGQRRFMHGDTDIPNIQITDKWADKFICTTTTENEIFTSRLTAEEIQSRYPYVAIDEDHDTSESLDDAQIDIIEPGQIRAATENEYPYIVVLAQESEDMFHVLTEYRNSEIKTRMSGANIRANWTFLRGYTYLSDELIATDDSGEDMPAVTPAPPESTDEWDAPQRTTSPQKSEDDADNIPLIAYRKELQWLFSNLDNMARILDMPSQQRTLKKINLWTPKTARNLSHDLKSSELDTVNQAIADIIDGFIAEYDNLRQDMLTAKNQDDES